MIDLIDLICLVSLFCLITMVCMAGKYPGFRPQKEKKPGVRSCI